MPINKIRFKTIDGELYQGNIDLETNDFFQLNNVKVYRRTSSISFFDDLYTDVEIVTFNKKHIIWHAKLD